MKRSIVLLRISVTDLRGSLLLLALVWCLLAVGGTLASGLGAARATFASCLAATVVVVAARPAPGAGRAGRAALALAVGALAGALAFALLAAAAPGSVGADRAASPGPWLWATALVLAPVFEELLYRERLLAALTPRTGGTAAVLLASAAFAIPHLEAAAMARAFAAGLGLGAVMLAGRSVAVCIGMHAGLNLGALLIG